MKSPNLGPLCCMPMPKIMKNSWTLKEMLQYILVEGYFKKKKNDDNKRKMKSPKVMNTLQAHI